MFLDREQVHQATKDQRYEVRVGAEVSVPLRPQDDWATQNPDSNQVTPQGPVRTFPPECPTVPPPK